MAQRWRWFTLALTFLGGAVLSGGAFAAEHDFRILHSEALAPSTRILSEPEGTARMSFQAYGRQFDLELQTNRRLLNKLPAAQKRATEQRYALYRGRLQGLPNTWVRLTQVGTELYGAIWDGQDLYAIEPARNVDAISLTPTDAATDSTPVVYRLSDVYLTHGAQYCALEAGEEQKSALAAYEQTVAELTAMATAGLLVGQIEIAVLADADFASMQSDPQGAALARMNVVDGIFSEQVQVTLLVPEVRVFNSSNNPFSSNNASTLLNQLADYRNANPTIRSKGLAHLFTGRELDGDTVGIAYINALCQARNGVSLSESRSIGLTSSALIAAHEIGHNFGAPHDGETDSVCSGTPRTYIMSPQLNGSSTFSQCSLQQMAQRIATAACITPAQFADGAINAPVAFSVVQNQPFDYPIDVTTSGTELLANAVTTINLSGNFSVESASVPGGNCTSGAGSVICQLGTLPPDSTRQVSVRLRALQVGTFGSEVVLTADNDKVSANNRLTPQITVAVQADMRVSVSPTSISALTRDTVSFAATVTASGVQDSTAAFINVATGSLTVQSATIDNGNCTIQTNSIACTLGTVARGTTRRLNVSLSGNSSGNYSVTVATGATNDGISTNNSATVNIFLRAAADVGVGVQPTSFSQALIGQTITATATVSSIGVSAANTVVLSSEGQAGLVIESVTPQTGSCSLVGNGFSCALGSMDAGAEIPVQIRLRGAATGNFSLPVRVSASNDDNSNNDMRWIGVNARHPVDVELSVASANSAVETRTYTLTLVERSLGWDSAANVKLTATLPNSFTILEARADRSNCVITQNTVTCTATTPLLRDGTNFVYIDVRNDTPGSYIIPLSLTADNDADTTNNSQDLTLQVMPLIDAAVTLQANIVTALVGQPFDAHFTITADARAVTAAELIINPPSWALAIESITVDGGNCTQNTDEIRCALGNLAPYETRQATLRLHGLTASNQFSFPIRVSAPGDVDAGNDVRWLYLTLIDPSDAALSGSASSFTALVDQTFVYAFEVWVPGSKPIQELQVSLPLPSGFTFLSVTSDSIPCTATSGTVNCNIGTLGSGERRQISLNLRSSIAGSFSTTATLSAFNDIEPQNDSRTVPVTITSPAPPAPAQSDSGGGGGGSTGWLTLMALGILACRRQRRS